MVVATDTSEDFPVPDGATREFLRSFGHFGVVLVNCRIEYRHTTTEELFPTAHRSISNGVHPPQRLMGATEEGDIGDQDARQDLRGSQNKTQWASEFDVNRWNCKQVEEWLIENGFASVIGESFECRVRS